MDEVDPLIEQAMAAARGDFLAFCLWMDPNFVVGPHHALLAEKLEAVRAGKIRRLMIFMPPRSSKSYFTSKLFPLFCLGHHPAWEMIEISHSNNLAEGFSREIRNHIKTAEYQCLFPRTDLRPDSRAANRWHTNRGGKFVAAGTGSGIAGMGAHLALIDDPLDEQDAYSQAERTRINRWYAGGLRSRLYPTGRVIITNTRWHGDDLAGHLLRRAESNPDADQWDVVSIPAILDPESARLLQSYRNKLVKRGLLPDDYPDMKAGETYWPRHEPQVQAVLNLGEDSGRLVGWTTEELLNTKENTPPLEWSAVYMQNPTAEEGNLIKRTFWKHWPQYEAPPACDFLLMTLDTAYSETEVADFSCMQLWGVFNDKETGLPNLICLENRKGRWPYDELVRKAEQMCADRQPDMVLIEQKASGYSLLQSLHARGVPVQPWNPDSDGRKMGGRDKHARVWSCVPLFSAGRIWIPEHYDWAKDLIGECAGFPTSPHDDQVDAMTLAVLWVKNSYMVNHPDDLWQGFSKGGRMERSRRRGYYI